MIRLLPIPFFDARRCEQYFSDMSKKGYHVNNVNKIFAVFEKGISQDYAYRIIPMVEHQYSIFNKLAYADDYYSTVEDKERDIRIVEYKNAGYSQIFRINNVYVFRGEKDKITDSISVNYYEETRINELIFEFNFQIFLSLAFPILVMFGFYLITQGGIVYSLARSQSWIVYYFVCATFIMIFIGKAKYYAQIKKEYDNLFIDVIPWKKKSKHLKINKLILGIFTLVILVLLSLQYKHGENQSIVNEKNEFPVDIIRIADIENMRNNESLIYVNEEENDNSVKFEDVLFAQQNIT